MNGRPLLSLCMPTNGVIEWVFPVLESIYSQKVDNSQFEVIVTDNGSNEEFKRKMQEYRCSHDNLGYVEVEALPFVNEIEAYKRANGRLIKFVNHRTLLMKGTLNKLVSFVEKYERERPITYFSNGVLNIEKTLHEYQSFDLFVRNLSYWSSWSTGMAIWKEDFEKLPKDVSEFNELFPHTNVLFNERKREKYIIDNTPIFDEIPQGKKNKGDYDLFYAFGVEYPWIICSLLIDNDITADTFRFVKDRNLEFIAKLYYYYVIRKKYCSYDLRGIKKMYGVFYSKVDLLKELFVLFLHVVIDFLSKKRI